jgi:peptide/nickel transport system permease protein
MAIGTISAVWKYSIFDKCAMSFAVIGVSMPSFWVGLTLLVIFSLKLGWLPISGMYSPAGGGLADLLRHLVLPSVSLALPNVAIVARLMRSSLLEVLAHDYIRTATGKGLSNTAVIYRHALRNALIPVLTVIGVQVGNLLSGSIVVETVFSWPGLGTLALAAILSRDIPLVQGVTLFVAVVFVVINLLVDVLYAYLDPRIKYG